MYDAQYFTLDKNSINHAIECDFSKTEIKIDKSKIGDNKNMYYHHNILAVARRYKSVK